MIRVLVVDEMQLVRESIACALDRRMGLTIVGTASSRRSCLAMAQNLNPNVVLISMRMTGSEDLIRDITETLERTRIVAWGKCDVSDVTTVMDGSINDMVAAVHSAADTSGVPVGTGMIRRWVQDAGLTRREQDIVELIDRGLSNKQIAQILHTSVHTVRNTVHSILGKLHVANRAQAASLVRSRTMSRTSSRAPAANS